MTFSKKKDGLVAIDRLEKWLASNPPIPQFRQRANKAEICRQIGIARSTADANPKIRAIFARLTSKALVAPHFASTVDQTPKCIVMEALGPPSLEHHRSAAPDRISPSLEHLLRTGRVIR